MRRLGRLFPICVAISHVLVGVSAFAATIRVEPDRSGDQPTIQAAIDAAHAGDVVELEDGVFLGEGNRDVTFRGKAITVRSRSGIASSCVIDCGGTSEHPHRAFVFDAGEGSGSVLEAVRLQSGRVWDHGGAILCVGTSPVLRNVQIFDSSAGFGGGLACIDDARPTVDHCLFTANRADFGSAVACHAASPWFVDCRFVANEVAEIGGALLCEAGSHPFLDRCLFADNWAEIGGGLACRDDSNPTLHRCEFTRNKAHAGGGEGGGAWCANSSPTFEDCVFTFNEAYGHGGAVVCVFASPRLVRCTLHGNRAPKGAGVYAWLESSPTLEGSIIAFSLEGEAIACEYDATAAVVCSDLYGNAGGDWIGAVAGQLADPGNFAVDPLFCDAAAGDVHLRTDSPCRSGHHPNAIQCGRVGALDSGCGAPGTADLALRKSADRASVQPGGTVTFTITLFNHGPAVGRDIVFGDPLPDPLNLVSSTMSRGTGVGQTFCALDSLAPQDSVTMTLVTVPIANPAPNERWFQNTAYIERCTTPDPFAANNQASLWTHITEVASDAQPGPRQGDRARLLWSRAPDAGTARFVVSLPVDDAQIDVSVFDVRGRRIAALARGGFAAGDHVVDWHHGTTAPGASSGVYWVRLRTSRDSVARRVQVVR